MFRDNWRTLRFWRWWWQARVPTDAKVIAAVLFTGALLVGGYFASGHLSGASAASNVGDSYVLQTTISKVVTVKANGRTVVKRVPVVVRRTIVHSSTAYATVVVTTPGGARYLTRKVVRYVPVVRKRIVRVDGKTTTVTETRLVPTVKTQTLTNVVTNQQTVTNQSTVVVNRSTTVTQPVTTVETQTVTLPPQTVTETQTQTETVVETVTQPAITITLPLP
jgi:hypothetical protein